MGSRCEKIIEKVIDLWKVEASEFGLGCHMSLSTLFVLGLPPEQHGAFQRLLNPANLPH